MGIDDALREAFAGGGGYERRFFGNRRGLEATLVTTMPLAFVPGAPLQRRLSLDTLRTLARNVAGGAVALRALLIFRPMLVIATGGYVCFPVVVAARLLCFARQLECRIALLEINAAPGLTNRLLGPLVDEVWVTYEASGRFFGSKARLTGAPVRASLIERLDPAESREALGLQAQRTTIVVMGGSQGARTINDVLATIVTLRALPDDWQILQISGERDYATLRARLAALAPGNVVRLLAYLPDPAPAYAAADIVVARAGASTLAELAATGTPAVLIPFPFAAEDHQAANARLFAAAGAAVVLRDADLTPESLLAVLATCLEAERRRDMRAAAAIVSPGGAGEKIVERVTALLGGRVVASAGPKAEARD